MSSLSSLFTKKEISKDRLFIVGERANATGSIKFRNALLNDNFDLALDILKEQENSEASALDLSVAYAGRNEKKDILTIIKKARTYIELPLMIDSTSIEVIESALKNYPGKAVVNSINLERGEQYLIDTCLIIKKYNAAVVGLVIDENGMALTVDEKIKCATRIINLALSCGIKEDDIFIDMLTFSLVTGDEKYKYSGIETLNAIKIIKENFLKVKTILGLSNVSFGLKPFARKILNNCFLEEARKYGLDAVIINPSTIIELNNEDRILGQNLIYAKTENALDVFISKYGEQKNEITTSEENENIDVEQNLYNKIVAGDKKNLENILQSLLTIKDPKYIIDNILIKGMEEVGIKFGNGETVLPFVLKSAEVMKSAIEFLKPFLKTESVQTRSTILLATVAGDVHDIGKNLIGIILENNGCKIIDAGVKVPIEKIVELYNIHKPDLIGLSGLLVKSSILMQDYLKTFQSLKMQVPVTLGGAALNKKYVDDECAPLYDGGVFYSQDAFDILSIPLKTKNGEPIEN